MTYRIYAFDGLALPEYVQDGDNQNIGSGEALTNFVQIPGGGYFDMYGSDKSPQGIRPISKTCVLWGDTSAALKTVLDNLRAKIGVRGKLTAYFDDGSLRWQWARLQRVDAPRPAEAVGNWLPVDLVWVTASQWWYGVVVTPAQWSWGDLTWTFGDGTVELGESGTSTGLTATGATTQDITLDNDGNIDVINMWVTVTAGSNSITSITVENVTNGTKWTFSGTISAGNVLSVDNGEMSVKNNGVDAYANFSPDDKKLWLTLDPGSNTIRVTVTGNTGQDGTIAFEYYDHYA